MKTFTKIGAMVLLLVMILGPMAAIADTVVTSGRDALPDTGTTVVTRDPYFHTGKGPIGNIFYFIGDLLALPFRLLGDLL